MKPGDFCWNELMTPDLQKAKQFYAALFNWQTKDEEIGDKTYTMFARDDKQLGGMLQIPKDREGQIPPHWMSYIFVEDLDSTLEKAKKLGAGVTMPATPVSDFGRFAVIQDPTGAHIALWQSLKGC